MKHTIFILVLASSFFSFSIAKLPELHDTTIAVFPGENPGDSLRFHEISYDGKIEKLECYSIGKTCFVSNPYGVAGDTFPFFDSASVLVSEKLENVSDSMAGFSKNLLSFLFKDYPSLLRTDTETIVSSGSQGCRDGWLFQGHECGILFAFNYKKIPAEGQNIGAGRPDKRVVWFVRDVFQMLRLATPIATKTVSKSAPIISKRIKPTTNQFLVNGRALPSRSMPARGFSPCRIITK
jgi:hypothetical protein